MSRHRSFTDDQFIKAVKKNKTIAGILSTLELQHTGGNYKTVHKLVKKFDLDVSHWDPYEGHKNRPSTRKIELSDILVKNSKFNRGHLKNRLIKNGLLKYQCSMCGICEWLDHPLSLQMDHINGEKFDNRIGNLRLLCPNCHSQTPTFAGRALKFRYDKSCIDCGKKIMFQSTRCKRCAVIEFNKTRYKADWPDLDKLEKMITDSSFSAVGRALGVSCQAVRKRLKVLRKSEIKN